MQSHNCWHRTAGFQIKKKKVIEKCLQHSCEMKARAPCYRRAMQSCRHCKTAAHTSWNYRASPSQCWQHPCDFTAHYRSMMATKNLKASHRHCKMPAPGWHHTIYCTTSPPQPQSCDFKKKKKKKSLPCRPRRIAQHCGKIRLRGVANTSYKPFGTEV
jgi:hypothetical protein